MEIVKLGSGNEVQDKIIEQLVKTYPESDKIKISEKVSFEDRTIFLADDSKEKILLIKDFKEKFENGFLIILGYFDFSFFENIDLQNVVVIHPDLENEKILFLKKIGVKYFSEVNDFEAVADYVTERARGKSIYYSIDFDVIDSAFAPGAKNPIIPGFSSREFLYFSRRIFHVPGLKAFDITSISFEKDEKFDFRTCKLAAKTIQEFLEINS